MLKKPSRIQDPRPASFSKTAKILPGGQPLGMDLQADLLYNMLSPL